MWDTWEPATLLARLPFNLDFLWATLGLVGIVLAGIICWVWVRKGLLEKTPPPEEDLARYRTLLEQGILNAEEYERIRARLEGKVRPGSPASPPAKE